MQENIWKYIKPIHEGYKHYKLLYKQKDKNESDNKQSEIKRKVIKQHEVGGKPMETNVKLSKCVENNSNWLKHLMITMMLKKTVDEWIKNWLRWLQHLNKQDLLLIKWKKY